jgi:hypothetical protein
MLEEDRENAGSSGVTGLFSLRMTCWYPIGSVLSGESSDEVDLASYRPGLGTSGSLGAEWNLFQAPGLICWPSVMTP